MKKRLIPLLLTLLFLFSGCAKPAPAAKPAEPAAAVESPAPTAETATDEAAPAVVSFTDMTGRSVTLPAPAGRIVALTAADCEILYAIGAGSAVIARGEYCNYPSDCLSLPAVASGSETNLESILALAPDAVVMSTMSQSDEQIAALEKAGIAVAVSDADTIAGVYESIIMLGTLTGCTEGAEKTVSAMQEAFEALKASVPQDAETKSIYFEVSPLEWGLWAAGKNTFMNEIAELLHLTNIFSDVDGWVEVSEEQVLSREPDVIVTTAMYFGEGPTPADEVLSRAGWQNLSAVQTKRVFNADSDAITRPGPRLADAAKALFDFVYGG